MKIIFANSFVTFKQFRMCLLGRNELRISKPTLPISFTEWFEEEARKLVIRAVLTEKNCGNMSNVLVELFRTTKEITSADDSCGSKETFWNSLKTSALIKSP